MSLFKGLIQKISEKRIQFYCLLILFVYLVLPFQHAVNYDYIPNDEIKFNLVPSNPPSIDSCPLLPSFNLAMARVRLVNDYDEADYGKSLNVTPGGIWKPNQCKFVHDIAVIVPYRGRGSQLKSFLHHIHPFLQKQLISYRIFVMEQSNEKEFNRGKLMNIGYVEALKIHHYHCFIFHDVDLLPLVEMNIYGCSKKPRHLSASINNWRYNLKYARAFGGVTAILQKHFLEINGFSNAYFGWGGEDDDLVERILAKNLDYCRFSPEVSRYYMIHHKPEPKNPSRVSLLNDAQNRVRNDGINSLEYKEVLWENKPLYTHYIVDV